MGTPSLFSLNPRGKGARLSVAAVVSLPGVSVDGMALGTLVWAQDAGAHFALTVSTAAVDHATVEAVPDNTALRWTKYNRSSLPVPPGAPVVWYDPQDINAGGAQPTDGASLAVWKNKGTLGSAWDALQAGAAKPTFKRVGAAGKINGLSSVISDGTQWMQTALNSARPSANFIMALGFRMTNLAALYALIDGHTGGRSGLDVQQTTGVLTMGGTGAVNTNKAVSAGFYDVVVCTFNGASCFVTLDGADSAVVNPANQALTGVTLWSIVPPPIFTAAAELLDVLIYEDSTTRAQIASFFAAKYGATPQ